MTQSQALDILKTGRNVFITGAAGSGKTYVLRQYIEWLKAHDIPVAITASTGIAATHMEGMTIHAWSGIGIKDWLSQRDVESLVEKSYLRMRAANARVLIIDEVSMLHHFRLDMIDQVLRALRQNTQPFGGLQVILSGDFFQLPPVTRRHIVAEDALSQNQLFEQENDTTTKFVYHARAWRELDLAVCYLHEQHRQDDKTYLDILNAMRDGAVTDGHKRTLEARRGSVLAHIEPTKLYSHNADVDAENERELAKLPGADVSFLMDSKGGDSLVATLKKGCLAPEILSLKPGAKVMFVKNNHDAGYANGTLGIVEECSYERVRVKTISGTLIDVEPASWSIEEDGKVKAEITQYPLRLAWAITVHKSQGLSLDAAEVDLSNAFERGMGYVALSRVRTLDGLSLKGLSPNAFLMHEEVSEYDQEFRAQSETEVEKLEQLNKKELEKMHNDFMLAAQGAKKEKKRSTMEITKDLFLAGKTLKEISVERNLALGTIIDHIEQIKETDPSMSLAQIRNEIPTTRLKTILAAFQKIGTTDGGQRPLTPVKQILGSKYSFEEIRIGRLLL
jgi:ATP-dependent exoDNAse (exonuclease V) alpha subunit